MTTEATFRYLNLERRWPRFERTGLRIDAKGGLRLAPAITFESVVAGTATPTLPAATGPAGIGVDSAGNVWYADPTEHRLLKLDACSDSVQQQTCMDGPGQLPGQLLEPHGVAVAKRGEREVLIVADSGNRRVQIFDLFTFQLLDVWSGPPPVAGVLAPGGFDTPWDLAVDRRGWVFVADPGRYTGNGLRTGGRVQRFSLVGGFDPEFTATMTAQRARPAAPVGVAIVTMPNGDERLLVLDGHPARVLVYTVDGKLDGLATETWAGALAAEDVPLTATVNGDVLYVATADGRLLSFDDSGSLLGSVTDDTAVAGIAIDCDGRLMATGADGGLRREAAGGRFGTCGTFLAGPFEVQGRQTEWQMLSARLAALPDGTHLRLFARTSDVEDGAATQTPPAPVACDGSLIAEVRTAEQTAALDEWYAGPWDQPEIGLRNAAGRYLWIAGILQGDGTSTPVLEQLRVDFDRPGWIRDLPALYRRQAGGRRLRSDPSQVRFTLPSADRERPQLTVLETVTAVLERTWESSSMALERLPTYLDPNAAPDEDSNGWLAWLATWVDRGLDERWNAAQRRAAVSNAFAEHARRGTVAGLLHALSQEAGVQAILDEGARLPGPWVLGSGSRIGLDSALVAADPHGAVLGTTAHADRSHLRDGAPPGQVLFDEFVHHFVVQVYAADLQGNEHRGRIEHIIEREKPAHTSFELCVLEPTLRVGLQATLGVDAIVSHSDAVRRPRLGGSLSTPLATPPGPREPDAGRRVGVDAHLQ